MEAIRKIIEATEEGNINISVPKKLGKKFEVIILPLDNVDDEMDDIYRLQENSEFFKEVVMSEEEDVWNNVL